MSMSPLFPFHEGEVGPPALLKTLPPASIAYLGDAVFELYIRTQHLLPITRTREFHRRVVACVRAETQAAFLQRLLPHLSDAEKVILRQGRNAASGRPKRLDLITYQQATALETLLGYLYLHDWQRLNEVLNYFSDDLVTAG